MELRIREVDEGGGGLTGTRASEAKGPFPGGKRVGSRGKKKKNAGVKARGKRVGSRGRKRKNCQCGEGPYFLLSFNHVGYA